MPHAEIKYSSDLDIDTPAVFNAIETTIQRHDAGSGACKGRAFRVELFHHSHVIVEVSVLPKPHRDEAFMASLLADLEVAIKAQLTQACAFSLSLVFSGRYYVTNGFEP